MDSLDHGSQVKSQIQLFTIWYVWLKSADMMTNDTAQSSTLSMRIPNLKLSHFLSGHLYWNNNCGVYSVYFLTKFCSMWLIIIPYISFRTHVKAHNTTDQHIFHISTQNRGHVRKNSNWSLIFPRRNFVYFFSWTHMWKQLYWFQIDQNIYIDIRHDDAIWM